MSRLQGSITFAQAQKLSGPAAFTTMCKPVGSRCNLDCGYCYYLDKGELYGGHEPTMSPELLEAYVRAQIEANQLPEVSFCWHGGEPLLAGLDFYRRAVALQEKYRGEKKIVNALQTNGLLVDRAWCDFWHEHDFLIGISIDGPQDIHDAWRLTRGGRPTWTAAMRAVELCAARGVEYNTLTTVNRLSEGRGAEVYRFLRGIGSRFMQLLPVVERRGERMGEGCVSARGYGRFLNDVFDQWVVRDVGGCFVQLFDVALAQWMGVMPGLCVFAESCGDGLVVEHNGDVYACDHFVDPPHRLGNLLRDQLREMFASPQQVRFGLDKRSTLCEECLRCKFLFACHGECPRNRFGEGSVSVLCEGYKLFFNHVAPYMEQMKALLEARRPAAMVMPWAQRRLMGYT